MRSSNPYPRPEQTPPVRVSHPAPHGHVIGYEVGASPPPPRQRHRPVGRIGPYGLSRDVGSPQG
jgi:hypothetical protein